MKPDALILHTTFLCMRWSHLFPTWKQEFDWVAGLDCVKLALPQDEYDHSEVLDEWLYELGADVVLSNFDAEHRADLYPLMRDRATFGHAYTGYIDDETARSVNAAAPPAAVRPFDVVYRASHLPYWFGTHGQLKHRIADAVSRRAGDLDLQVDISTRDEDTIIGTAWLEFLASGRCVVGCESGSSVLDRRGEIRARIQLLLRAEPDLTFDEVSERMWPGWDAYAFFALSPRHLEAVLTRTGQILVAGQYDGVLEAGRHYVELNEDFSNIDDALRVAKDPDTVDRLTAAAYDDIVGPGRLSYAGFAQELERFLSDGATSTRGSDEAGWKLVSRALSLNEAVDRHRSRRLRNLIGMSRPVWVRGIAALRLAGRRRSLRALLRAGRQPDVRGKELSANALVADVLRLGLIGLANAGRGVGPRFVVESRLERAGTVLTLMSRPVDDDEPVVPRRPTSLTREEVARLDRIVWDHTAVGKDVPYEFTRSRWVSVGIGLGGRYEFRALPVLVGRTSTVQHALNDVLGGNGSAGSSLAWRIRHHPVLYARLLALVLRWGARLPRPVVRGYLRAPIMFQKAPPLAVARDLMRFATLQRFLDARHDSGSALLWLEAETSTLFVDAPETGRTAPPESAGIAALCWRYIDGNSLGVPILPGRREARVTVSPDEPYTFSALAALARRYPREMSRFFESLIATV